MCSSMISHSSALLALPHLSILAKLLMLSSANKHCQHHRQVVGAEETLKVKPMFCYNLNLESAAAVGLVLANFLPDRSNLSATLSCQRITWHTPFDETTHAANTHLVKTLW